MVANDVDEQRCYMLVHQVKRISSPCVMMTNYAAQLFPAIQIQEDNGTSGDPAAFFDRILCDVPCRCCSASSRGNGRYFSLSPPAGS